MFQVTRQSAVRRMSMTLLQPPVQFRLQPPGRRPQAVLGEVGRAIASVFAAQIVFFVATWAPDAFQAPDGFQ